MDDPSPDYPVVRGPDKGPYACPCCRHITLPERGAYEICPTCLWEDDGQDDPDADVILGGPNGDLSLARARQNFAEFGAISAHVRALVRPPRDHELPLDG